MKILIVFIAIILYKALSNCLKMCQTKYYKKDFLNYLTDNKNNIEQHKLQTIKLLKGAGVSDTYIPVTQLTGYGQAATIQASVFTNFPSNMQFVAVTANSMFDNAIGVYRSRIFESFNPIYWIELVIFLPKNILSYIGLDSEKTAFKLCNVILTCIWWVITAFFVFFKTELINIIIEFLGGTK